MSVGGYWLKIDNSQKTYFSKTVPARVSDDKLNSTMAGTNPFYILIKGKNEDTIKQPEVLNFIDGLQGEVMNYTKAHAPADIEVSVGGGTLGGVALNEIMIHEKVLNILQIMLAVGIGADYGIYMSYGLREELKADPENEKRAIEKAFKSAGKATIFVSTAVACGFGVLMLSFGFMVHIWMGFLIALAMLVSSVTALTLFPALIFSFKPKLIFEERTQSMNLKPIIASIFAVAFIATQFPQNLEAEALSSDQCLRERARSRN